MRINAVNNTYFQGLYRIDKRYLGDNTRNFFQDKSVIITPNDDKENDLFVLTHDDDDTEFEECIKNDKGKFWKSVPLVNLMAYPIVLEAIFHGNAVDNKYKPNWVDYTDKCVPNVDPCEV